MGIDPWVFRMAIQRAFPRPKMYFGGLISTVGMFRVTTATGHLAGMHGVLLGYVLACLGLIGFPVWKEYTTFKKDADR